ncbi:hypothetical protein [Thermovenabulum gondwanense]|nr:hypothetical protein [Thermovenabulum gondwanense]
MERVISKMKNKFSKCNKIVKFEIKGLIISPKIEIFYMAQILQLYI